MIELTVDMAVTLLREAVADRGRGHCYWPQENLATGDMDCLYVHGAEVVRVDSSSWEYKVRAASDLTPGCIVGHVLISAGVRPQRFLDLNLNRETPAITALAALAEDGILNVANPKVVELLEAVQVQQDNRVPWGEAVDAAMKEVFHGPADKG